VEFNGTTMDPLGWPDLSLIRVLVPQFWDTVYISEVNVAKKVKSNSYVAMNNNLDSWQKIFLRGDWEKCPQMKL